MIARPSWRVRWWTLPGARTCPSDCQRRDPRPGPRAGGRRGPRRECDGRRRRAPDPRQHWDRQVGAAGTRRRAGPGRRDAGPHDDRRQDRDQPAVRRPPPAASADSRGLEALPKPQSAALGVAFGLIEGAAEDPFLIGLATLTLLADAAASTPILVVADDVQWLDRPSADALAFVARRLGSDPLVMVVGLREGEESPFEAAGIDQLALEPLSDRDARDMVARLAPELAPSVRDRILREAAGNPLALAELSATIRHDTASGEGLPDVLPLSARLEREFAARAARRSRRGSRPAPTRRPDSTSSRPRRSGAQTRSTRTSRRPTLIGPKPTPTTRSTTPTGPWIAPGWRSSTRSTPASMPTRRRERWSSAPRRSRVRASPGPGFSCATRGQSFCDPSWSAVPSAAHAGRRIG